MKKLPKIAIVYDKANWKTTTKIAVDLLRSKDEAVVARKDDMCFDVNHDNLELYLCNHGMEYKWDKWQYLNANRSILLSDGFKILTMPQDFDKLKSYFEEEFKDGDVYSCSDYNDDRIWLIRIKSIADMTNYFSIICPNGNYYSLGRADIFSRVIKATPEEEAKLIEEEHANGYHWDSYSNELVTIADSWKDIYYYIGMYQVNIMGDVRGLSRYEDSSNGKSMRFKGKDLKLSKTKDGYLKASLSKHNNTKGLFAHRLVAEAFIPNPENKPCVNHKDGVKHHNWKSNLEWTTYSENQQHAYDTGLMVSVNKGKFGAENHTSKGVVQLDLDMNLVCEYGSISEANRETGFSNSSISRNINSLQDTPHKGFYWKTKEAFEAQNKPNETFTSEDFNAIKSAFDKETSKLRSRLNKKSEKIKELEEYNEKLLKSIERGEREYERFEKKLHSIKFDINEFLKK